MITTINEFKKYINESKKDRTELIAGDKIILTKDNEEATVNHWIDKYKTKLSVKTKDGNRIINLNAIEKVLEGKRSDKQYKKEVALYKFFVVNTKTKKVESGWEFKDDAKDALSDFDGDKDYKVLSELQLKKLGIENPKQKWINESNNTKDLTYFYRIEKWLNDNIYNNPKITEDNYELLLDKIDNELGLTISDIIDSRPTAYYLHVNQKGNTLISNAEGLVDFIDNFETYKKHIESILNSL